METTFKLDGMDYTLTTEHPLSSYGVPVLLLEGQAYGSYDRLPCGRIGFAVVQASRLPAEGDVLSFLKSCPDLYYAD